MSVHTSEKSLVIVVGPTGIGKTVLAIRLALHYNTEIISCDSRQFYREMNIGTAKPGQKELEMVKHHFVDSLSIEEDYNAGLFEQDATRLLESLFESTDVVIAVGGAGLYIQALCAGIDDIPEVNQSIREAWLNRLENEGLGYLQEKLKHADPEYYEQVDIRNPQRLIRALEVWEGTGKPYSTFLDRKAVKRSFRIHKIGLETEREILYSGLDKRMDEMIGKGLFDEAKELYPFRHLNALQTVGYTEIFDFIDEKYNKEEAVRLLKRNSRRYAKRQLTWFRKDESIQWFKPGEEKKILTFLESNVNEG